MDGNATIGPEFKLSLFMLKPQPARIWDAYVGVLPPRPNAVSHLGEEIHVACARHSAAAALAAAEACHHRDCCRDPCRGDRGILERIRTEGVCTGDARTARRGCDTGYAPSAAAATAAGHRQLRAADDTRSGCPEFPGERRVDHP